MAVCEKCWKESGGNPEEYQRLLKINKCTLEEQAGENARICHVCAKKTVHQYADYCLYCRTLVNALAGIENPAEYIANLKQRNAELVEALKKINKYEVENLKKGSGFDIEVNIIVLSALSKSTEADHD